MSATTFPQLFTPIETAKILGVTRQTLAVWRTTQRYPLPYVKTGRLVRYKAADVEQFITDRTIS